MGQAAQDKGGRDSVGAEELRLRSPVATLGLSCTIVVLPSLSGRFYLKGHTYAVREVLALAGALWCPTQRMWFTRDARLAEDIRHALLPGHRAVPGKPKRRLHKAPTPLTQLRQKYAGTDVRCELCRSYEPTGADTGTCPKGQAFRFGVCLDFQN